MKNLVLIVFLIFLDQILKYLFNYLDIDWYIFSLAYNYGISFGINFNLFLIILISIIFLILLFYLYYKGKLNKRVFIFFVAGTFSNLIDRVLNGYVIDYLNFFNIFIFNLADLYINLALFILVYEYIKNEFKGKVEDS